MPKRWRFMTPEAAVRYGGMITRLAVEEIRWERQKGRGLTTEGATGIIELRFDKLIDDFQDRVIKQDIRAGEYSRNAVPLPDDPYGAPRWSSDFSGHTIYWTWWVREGWFVVLDVVR